MTARGRVAIVSAVDPFGTGLHRVLAAGLAAALRARGHPVEEVLAPVSQSAAIAPQCRLFHSMDLRDVVDHVVALRPPAHLIRHERLSVWLSCHAEYTTETYATEIGRDAAALAGASHLFATSAEAAVRWATLVGRDVPVLLPPLPAERSDRGDPTLAWCPGPLAATDRVKALLRAMRLVQTPVRLHLGPTTDPLLDLELRLQAARCPDRISLEPVQAGALVCLSADDDAALRVMDMAAACGAPTVVATDCPAARVRAEAGAGLAVAADDPVAIAAALDSLVGHAAPIVAARPDWDAVIAALLGP